MKTDEVRLSAVRSSRTRWVLSLFAIVVGLVVACMPEPDGRAAPAQTAADASASPTQTARPLDSVTSTAALPAGLPPTVLEVVRSIEQSDRSRIAALLETQRVACEREGTGPVLPCDAGQSRGTIYSAVPVATCDGGWRRDVGEVARQIVAGASAPFAVAQLGVRPDWWTTLIPYGNYLVVFSPTNQVQGGTGLYLSEASIVRVQIGCRMPADFLAPGIGESPMTTLWRAP